MPGAKAIANSSQAFTAGATWGNPAIENQATVDVGNLLNNTGLVLYIGDVVCLDVTGTQAILATAANDPSVIGVVGGYAAGDYTPSGSSPLSVGVIGNAPNPFELSPNRSDSSVTLTNGSATVLDAAAVASDLGKTLVAPSGSGSAQFTIIAVTAGTGFTISSNYLGTTAATYVVQVNQSPSGLGPGWSPNSFAPGVEVPIVLGGFARINVNGLTTVTAKAGVFSTASASVIPTYTVTGSVTAAQSGAIIAIPLEAYAARDTTLTSMGIAGHDTLRALIKNG